MTVIVNGDTGLTFPNTTQQASAGKIVQIVNSASNVGFTSSSNVLADLGLSATITPLFATSKILVAVNVTAAGKETGNTYFRLALLRGSSILIYFENIGALTGGTVASYVGSACTTCLDSPATTNATTYKIQASSGNGNAVVYIGGTLATINSTHTMTLMEVAV